MDLVVEMKNVVKRFGELRALDGVDLEVLSRRDPCAPRRQRGRQVDTDQDPLRRLPSDVRRDFGLTADRSRSARPRDAADVGIGTVYQDLALAPLMPVSRNFFMGRELMKQPELFGVLDDARMDEIALEQMKMIGIDIANPRQPVGTLSGGQRQTLAIARAIYFGAHVLILDEPTSALGQKQQMQVLKTIMRVRARGNIAIIFITHNESHARLVADRYTFLSLGEVIGRGTRDDLVQKDIRQLMAGGRRIGGPQERD